jgi:predicted GH43/DUF377 family glycosyl hydrolase
VRRHPDGPILTREQIPDIAPLLVDASSVFNPGAVYWQGRYRLLLRVQARSRQTHLVWAVSDDGVNFDVEPRVVEVNGLDAVRQRLYHVYDPRLTVVEDELYCCFAADTDAACRIGIARVAADLELELVHFDEARDTRNAVLFPRKIDGNYWRLDRPNVYAHEGGPSSGSVITAARSDDLASWQVMGPVAEGRPHFWDELIGAGPPPIWTPRGWLLIYHGVATHFQSANIYQAGVMLLDHEDPTQVLGRSHDNVLEPRELYEYTGQVPNVVFPSGLIERGDELLLYYGAADTCVGWP